MSDANSFFEIAGRYPLLTQAQEIQLGRRIQRWLKDPDPSPAIIRDGRRAREHFVNCNLRLVISVAKRYRQSIYRSSMSFGDILQEGVIGLQRAAEKYDPECGYKMSTYAYWWIRQAITRAIESKSGAIHISSTAKRKYQKFQEAALHGGTVEEILERAGLCAKDLRLIRQASMCYQVHELDAMDLSGI